MTRSLVGGCCVVCLAASPLAAQATGQVSGVIRDATGEVVEGAIVIEVGPEPVTVDLVLARRLAQNLRARIQGRRACRADLLEPRAGGR